MEKHGTECENKTDQFFLDFWTAKDSHIKLMK